MENVHPLRIVLDIFILLIVALPVIVFATAIYPYRRGFYCDDETIRYPYKDSTVENIVLYIFGVSIPLVTILIVEAYRTYCFEPKYLNSSPEPRVCIKGRPCALYYTRLYYYVGYFLFGAALGQVLTDIGKYCVGRLRPHFIAVCKPDWAVLNCTGHTYVQDPHCTGSEWFIREARLSFPSGHSSFAFYSMIFGVYYLQAQLVWPLASRLLKHVLQFLFICIALGTALSRISDYKHHWSDVFSGSILGITVATFVTVFLMGLFRYPKQQIIVRGLVAPDVITLQKMATNRHQV